MKKLLLTTCVLALPAFTAWANDTTAELAAGGLQFTTNTSIQMSSEDLYVSTEQVRVTYKFVNDTDKNVATIVAFPMPDIAVTGGDDQLAIPTDNPENILDFRTTVDGRPVATKVQQRVYALGIDRTELLKGLGVPLAPHLPATGAALERLSHDKQEELIRIGLGYVEEINEGKGAQKHFQPTWTLKTVFYWDQTFPAKQTVRIEHSYKPSVGGSAVTSLGEDYAIKEPYYRTYLTKYCIEPSLAATYQKLKSSGKGIANGGYGEQRVSYVLTTGANWAGPIGSFRLVVDKGDPKNLVSFCADGLKKISPTQFEVKKTDFTPERDLDIVLLIPTGP